MKNSMQTFWNDLDKKPVDNILKEILNGIAPKMEWSPELKRGKYPNGASNDILEHTGIFKTAISSCNIETFNAEIIEDDRLVDGEEETKVAPYHRIWMTLHLNYPGNGMKIVTIWYNENNDGLWQYRSEKNWSVLVTLKPHFPL